MVNLPAWDIYNQELTFHIGSYLRGSFLLRWKNCSPHPISQNWLQN
jgi:hypothetical protein